MALWSLIFKVDAAEHDAVPNKWLKSSSKCWYPDKSKSTANKLAKENASVIIEDDWIELDISIVKKDFDNFDRCMKDAIRLNHGKRTLTASENEERGRGLRPKRPLFESESDSSASSPPKPRKSPRKQTVKTQELNFPKYPATPKKGTPKKSKPLQIPRTLNESASRPTSRHQNVACEAEITCKIKRKHFCVFKQGALSMEKIGHGICAISRGLTVLRAAMEDSHLDIISRLPPSVPSQETVTSSEAVFEDDVEDHTESLAIFPMKSVGDFQLFDQKLSGDQYRKQVMTALMSVATKTSYSRAVTSILRYVLHEGAVKHFSWKGQKRWRDTKISFSSTLFSKMLTDAMKKKWPAVEKLKIERTIASWLAQTQLKKKQQSRSIPEDVPEDVQEETGEGQLQTD